MKNELFYDKYINFSGSDRFRILSFHTVFSFHWFTLVVKNQFFVRIFVSLVYTCCGKSNFLFAANFASEKCLISPGKKISFRRKCILSLKVSSHLRAKTKKFSLSEIHFSLSEFFFPLYFSPSEKIFFVERNFV